MKSGSKSISKRSDDTSETSKMSNSPIQLALSISNFAPSGLVFSTVSTPVVAEVLKWTIGVDGG
jgi:hypothetical protein